ncbi:MAG: histidine ammonia-lyase [Chitinophagales bacterium]|nr:histidine ammonia-lyase [Chitinophagales bacterium]
MEIGHKELTINSIKELIEDKNEISLSKKATEAIVKCRAYLDKKINEKGTKYYGINTGFGSLCDVEIQEDQISELQENLVKSHACGVGKPIPKQIVKLMLLLKIQNLSYGHSGVSLETVQRLIDFYNKDILPVIYDTGSLGASGDLSPLAHLSLPLLGLGEVYIDGVAQSSVVLEKKYAWKPLKLQSKEGLALLNGTQFMSAYGVFLLIEAKKLYLKSNKIAACSLDAYNCRLEPFNFLVHKIRPHKGQVETAKQIRELLEGSEIANQNKVQVQDPYSFRCIPQVHGASFDAIQHIAQVFETEINSVTDNPNIFPDEDEIISAGNFHGQTLALNLDFLKLALAELGNISERRIYLLMSGNRGLPAYLSPNPGLHSGFMIAQYTAASLVSKNKQLATPASIDSVPSSNGQEDHVSMGANAAVQCYDLLENVQQIVAIESIVAVEALKYRKPLKSSQKVEDFVEKLRIHIPELKHDRVLHYDLLKAKDLLF